MHSTTSDTTGGDFVSLVIAQINPETSKAIEAVALLIASRRATSFEFTEEIPVNQIRLVEVMTDTEFEFTLNPAIPTLLDLGLQFNDSVVRVALGMSDASGKQIPLRVIREINDPSGSLCMLMPEDIDKRIAFLADVFRGRIANAREENAAFKATRNTRPDQYGHAHVPPGIRRHFRHHLYRNGALVTTFDDGEALGVHLSNRAQKMGLDCRQFEGFPSHWHVEKWTIIYGSGKAPKPYEDAGLTREELQDLVRANLLCLLPRNEEGEDE